MLVCRGGQAVWTWAIGWVGGWCTHARIVHIDVDPADIHKNKHAHIPICAGALSALTVSGRGPWVVSMIITCASMPCTWKCHVPVCVCCVTHCGLQGSSQEDPTQDGCAVFVRADVRPALQLLNKMLEADPVDPKLYAGKVGVEQAPLLPV